MRPISLIVATAFIAVPPAAALAQGDMRVAPSSRGMSEVTLTFADSAVRANSEPAFIRVDYGQPHLRGRTLHTDSLVPYDRPWRTGANDPTTLTTDVDIILGGREIPKGKYILQTLPSRTGWKLLVQKEPPPNAPDAPYDPSKDFARIDLRQRNAAVPFESLTIWLIPARAPGKPRGELVIAWGNVSLATDWVLK